MLLYKIRLLYVPSLSPGLAETRPTGLSLSFSYKPGPKLQLYRGRAQRVRQADELQRARLPQVEQLRLHQEGQEQEERGRRVQDEVAPPGDNFGGKKVMIQFSGGIRTRFFGLY